MSFYEENKAHKDERVQTVQHLSAGNRLPSKHLWQRKEAGGLFFTVLGTWSKCGTMRDILL